MVSATNAFYHNLGLFYANHATSELLVDLAIGKLLGLSNKRAHAITTYVDFGRRVS
jgi:hypothetical protein